MELIVRKIATVKTLQRVQMLTGIVNVLKVGKEMIVLYGLALMVLGAKNAKRVVNASVKIRTCK